MFVFIQVQEPAGNAVRDNKKNRGVNLLGMGKLLGSVTIARGGLFPNNHQTLMPIRLAKGRADIGFTSQEL